MNATITLRDYISKKKTFVVPSYQRGYIWGRKPKESEKKDAVTYILENSLIPGFENNTQVFIQGITVCEDEESIVLVDGQQRTTFFFLLLKYLKYDGQGGYLKMEYEIREESNIFLSQDNELMNDISEDPQEPYQDIYFFKKTLRTIDRVVTEKCTGQKEDEEKFKIEFLDYLLDNVRFLYIDIPADKATKVFSMMNGSKAEMRNEEIIKAELLRLASLNNSVFENKSENEKNAIEWDNNMLRSRYAREWDKWLQWWNREDVKKLFKHTNVMGFLVYSFFKARKKNENLSFDSFKNQFLNGQNPIEAKTTFDGLRRLQKHFEDAFNNSKIYNWVGAILRIGTNKDEFVQWYFVAENRPSDEDLENYYKCSFLGLTHKEIVTHNQSLSDNVKAKEEDKFDFKFNELYQTLASDNLYIDNADAAFHLLLRLNIDEDNKQENGQGRKFDFSIWDRKDSRGRSLEHIFPKSKVLHKEKRNEKTFIVNGNGVVLDKLPDKSSGYIARASCRYFEVSERREASEHSIGNLVLLYKDDNSAFNDSSFEEKKSMFFLEPNCKDAKKKQIFKSRHLLHTIYKFAQSSWAGEQIARNKYQTLKDFKEYYGQ